MRLSLKFKIQIPKIFLGLLIFYLIGCFGGGMKMPETMKSIGWYPVVYELIPPFPEFSSDFVSREIPATLERLGFFHPVPVLTKEKLTLEKVDSASTFPLLVQIRLEQAAYHVEKHTLIPFIIFRPRLQFKWVFDVKIVNPAQKKYAYSGKLIGKAEKKVNWDIVDYDQNDPDLQLSAIEKQQFELKALRNFVLELNKILIKLQKQK